MLEVAHVLTLGLLGTEEGNGSLGRDGSDTHGLGCGDDGEAVALRLPGKVNDGVLDGVDNFNGDTLFLDAEDLKSGGLRLLGLGVSVDLDTEVGGLGLPVELGVADTEEVEGSDDLF